MPARGSGVRGCTPASMDHHAFARTCSRHVHAGSTAPVAFQGFTAQPNAAVPCPQTQNMHCLHSKQKGIPAVHDASNALLAATCPALDRPSPVHTHGPNSQRALTSRTPSLQRRLVNPYSAIITGPHTICKAHKRELGTPVRAQTTRHQRSRQTPTLHCTQKPVQHFSDRHLCTAHMYVM